MRENPRPVGAGRLSRLSRLRVLPVAAASLLVALAVTVTVAAGPAAATEAATGAAAPAPAPAVLLAAPATPPTTDANTAPPGPDLNQPASAAHRDSSHKVIVGLVALALLVIVYFGHRLRNRHRRRFGGS